MAAASPALVRRRSIFRRVQRRGGLLFWSGVFVLALLIVMAVFAPLLAPHDPEAIDLSNALAGATGDHPLGTDQSGRDILSRLIWGSRTSLLGPLGVVVLSTVLGVAIGVTAAWRGGWVDAASSRAVDFLFSFPGLLLAILAVALFGSGLVAPVLALAIAYTPYIARFTRGAALLERERPYIAAGSVQGFGALAICLRHLIPNIAPLVLAQATVNFGYALIDLAALSYLGLGVQPPTADWGVMISEGQTAILRGAPQQSLWAGGAIVAAVVAFNVIGEGLADRVARRQR